MVENTMLDMDVKCQHRVYQDDVGWKRNFLIRLRKVYITSFDFMRTIWWHLSLFISLHLPSLSVLSANLPHTLLNDEINSRKFVACELSISTVALIWHSMKINVFLPSINKNVNVTDAQCEHSFKVLIKKRFPTFHISTVFTLSWVTRTWGPVW